jgi:two-component system LytT family response regulator
MFVRIHRTTIVNVDRIQEIEALPQGDFAVKLSDRTTLRLSRSYRARLLP